ncbi:hypothetical protein ARTSIC4J27_2063 [Pseudarthrobacter siccitolerans]|uniref:Uncharacterized protein n=1 Tax=Pseudarthrobacter siccitolerans TaxID=861266 RepID=A0A024H273_9MICC|nr:hypothetical protein [Pseudarthrobacter siccitolerans]CCQ46103.1 hypothetical protein ARTSIC4J27_2063 [Pseudarthrobacter siccitolerans]
MAGNDGAIMFTPTPEQAAVLFDAGLIFVEELPGIAAQWLAEGIDSESLRLLAGADHDDLDDIRRSWTEALDDLHVRQGSTEQWFPAVLSAVAGQRVHTWFLRRLSNRANGGHGQPGRQYR